MQAYNYFESLKAKQSKRLDIFHLFSHLLINRINWQVISYSICGSQIYQITKRGILFGKMQATNHSFKAYKKIPPSIQ